MKVLSSSKSFAEIFSSPVFTEFIIFTPSNRFAMATGLLKSSFRAAKHLSFKAATSTVDSVETGSFSKVSTAAKSLSRPFSEA